MGAEISLAGGGDKAAAEASQENSSLAEDKADVIQGSPEEFKAEEDREELKNDETLSKEAGSPETGEKEEGKENEVKAADKAEGNEEEAADDEEGVIQEEEQPQNEEAEGDLIGSGSSNNISWQIDKEGRLTLTGSGDYGSTDSTPPWYQYREEITSAKVSITGLTSTQNMFAECINLKSVDLSDFDTSQVTNMCWMFYGCSSLEGLDLSNLDTSSVTDMRSMFKGCTSIEGLDLSSIDTSQVTTMYNMFNACSSLKSLNLSGIDTSRVTNMCSMFYGCSSLEDLDLSGFDTSQLTNMNEMFYGCSNLKSLDLSSFDVSTVPYSGFTNMFDGDMELNYICTPKNCAADVALPAKEGDEWYDRSGEVHTALPNSGNSIELYKNGYPGADPTKQLAYIEVSAADKEYDKKPYEAAGAAVVKDSEGNIITSVTVTYSYQGTLEDGTPYEQTAEAPTQAGSYTLLAAAENDDYSGCRRYDFKLLPKEVTITAPTIEIKTGESLPDLSEQECEIDGLVEGDNLTMLPQLKYSAEDISTSGAGSYGIIPYDADAGNNYSITYVNGTLTVGENKQTVSILGISIEDKVYDGAPIAYTGAAVVKDAEGNTITDVTTARFYQGTLADGLPYEQITQAPTQAGTYTLIFTIEENDKYTAEPSVYDFTIEKREVTITAPTIKIKIGETLPDLNERECEITGLLEGDELIYQPWLDYSEWGISTDTAGSYAIIPYNAYAGNNYSIKYVNGKLTIENPYDYDDSSYTDDERINLATVGTIASIKAKTYDGLEYKPVVKVTVKIDGKKKTLVEGTDYRVSYKNNLNVGEGSAYVRGNGIYKGELEGKFKIKPKSVKKLKIVTGNVKGSITEDNISQNLPVYVYDGGELLDRWIDYNLSFKKSTDKAVTLTVTAANGSNYTGSSTAKLTVYNGVDEAKLINPGNVTIEAEGKTFSGSGSERYKTKYTGKAIKPTVTVQIGTAALTNKDYKVAYQNNKNAGTAYVIVTGKGEYKGKAVLPFNIEPNRDEIEITNVIKDKTYNGKLQKPAVTVKAGNIKLKKNKDYTVEYENNLHAGTATITVTGRGNFTGSLKKPANFNILKQDIKKVSIKGTQKGGLEVCYGKRQLRKDSDYKLDNVTEKGKNKLEVTITAADNSDFSGSVTKKVKLPVYVPVLKDADKTIEKEVGDTYKLEVEEPEYQVEKRIAISKWESSNPDVVSVDDTGLLTMKKMGVAIIKMYAGRYVQKCYVVVKGQEDIPEGSYVFHKTPGSYNDSDAIRSFIYGLDSNEYVTVYIPAGVYWIEPVRYSIPMRSNMSLIMSPGALIMALPNTSTNYNVIWAWKLDNITISGGTIIGDRSEHGASSGEWGHGIGIYDCTNVTIENVDISGCWGDGIYLGVMDEKDNAADSKYITITGCNVHDNRRNNLSITGADNVTIDNCKFNYAKGTDPQFGIDIETNRSKNPCEHITILNTEMKGNAKASMGIMTKANDIRLENCQLSGHFWNWAGNNIVIKNTTIKGEVVDKTGGIKRQ